MKNSNFNYNVIFTLFIALTSSFIFSGCGSDNDSAALAEGVEKEIQKQNGTLIESVFITGGDKRLVAEETAQLSATGLDSNGEERDITNELTWTSSDEAIATVNSDGLVTAIKSSDINGGLVIITGTTIFDVFDEANISVSDADVSSITLRQISPETGNVNTCIDAKLALDVTYEDGFESTNVTQDVDFSIEDNDAASIDDDGTLYTSSELLEDILVKAELETFTDELTVTADPSNLTSVYFFVDEESVTIKNLVIGGRATVNAEALISGDTTNYNIDKSINWIIGDSTILGLTNDGDNKGTLLGLKTGVTTITGECGGFFAPVTVTVSITGDDELSELSINEGADEITLTAGDALALTAKALYDSGTSLNVSEFADWNLNGSELLTVEFVDMGTDDVSYTITSTEGETGVAVISVNYDGQTTILTVNVE